MKPKLTPISTVVENLFKKESSPFSEIYFLFQLHKSWKQLAGQDIAKWASPIQFKNQELSLSLPDSTHLQEMHFAKEALKNNINNRFKDKKVKKIILRVARYPKKANG